METPEPIIAVVEDDESIAEMLELILITPGTRVVSVPPSEQIVTDLQVIQPRLVILDMWLGSVDGVTILQRMRTVDGLTHVPVIFFTSTAATVHYRLPDPAALGAQIVAKPDVGRLLAVVRTTMQSPPQ